jgi:hypothetical protein
MREKDSDARAMHRIPREFWAAPPPLVDDIDVVPSPLPPPPPPPRGIRDDSSDDASLSFRRPVPNLTTGTDGAPWLRGGNAAPTLPTGALRQRRRRGEEEEAVTAERRR